MNANDSCKISNGELEAVGSKFTIHAIEALLNDSTLILTFLRNIEDSLGLTVHEISLEEAIAVSMLMNKVKLDFDDANQHYLAKNGGEAVVSYDEHFNKVDIKRNIRFPVVSLY